MDIALIYMASGRGRRFGSNKSEWQAALPVRLYTASGGCPSAAQTGRHVLSVVGCQPI